MQNHVFQIEKLRKFTLYGVLIILALIISLILLFQTSYIQTEIAQYITKEFSSSFNSKIEIKNVKISLFKGFVFDGVYIEDQNKDTLLFANKLSVIPSGFQLDFKNLDLKQLYIDSLFLNIYEIEKDSLNIQFVFDALNKKDSTKSKNFKIELRKFNIEKSRLIYNVSDTIIKTKFNYKDLNIRDLNVDIENVVVTKNSYLANIKSIKFKDKCGFEIDKFSSDSASINPSLIKFKNLNIKTNNSFLLFDSLSFNYPQNYNFSNINKDLIANIVVEKHSYVSFKDISYFIDGINDFSDKVYLSGTAIGSVDNFSLTNLKIKQKGILSVNLNSKTKGLNTNNPFVFADVNYCSFNLLNIQNIPFLKNKNFLKKMPHWLKELKTIKYKGVTKGYLSDFETKGKLIGEFGEISLNAVAKKDSSSAIKITGNFEGKDLQLSKIIQNNDFGNISFSQKIKLSVLKNKKINLQTSGIISDVIYKKHLYKNVNLYANMHDNKYDSLSISFNQPSIKANVFGKIDLSSKIPEFNLFANVDNANISSLNLFQTSTNSSLKFKAYANFKGVTLNDFEGIIKLTSPLVYKKDSSSFIINKLNISSFLTNKKTKEKLILLKSDIADATIITNKNPNGTLELLNKLKNKIFYKNFNEIISQDKKDIIAGPINFEVDIKRADILLSFFSPAYYISNNTKIYGFYNPNDDNINMSLNTNNFKYKNVVINDFYVIAYTKDNKIYAGIGGSSAKPNETFYVENINLEGDLSSDTINFNLTWDNFNETNKQSANISGLVKVKKKENNKRLFDCTLNKSNFIINGEKWKTNEANIVIDSTKISIYDLIFTNKKQKLYFDGNLSEYQGDILYAKYDNFDISTLQPLIENNITLEGELNGSTTFAQLYDKPLIFTKDSIINLNINSIKFGNFYFTSNWDNISDKIHVNAYNLKGRRKKFMNDTIYGDYWPSSGKINFTTEIRSMLIKTFEDYYSEYVGFNPSTYVKGNVIISGNYKTPKIKGNLKLKEASAFVKYLNTYYSINDMEVLFNNKNITISETEIYSLIKKDKKFIRRGSALIKGNISHKMFSNFTLDIDITANDIGIMNLEQTESSYFFGIAFGSGNANFSGSTNNLFLDASLRTNQNTFISIPMSSNRILEDEKNFIRFVSVDTAKTKKEDSQNTDAGGFTMNLKMDITPDAEIQIIPDENGEIITKGEGSLNLTLDSESNFNMVGSYVISEGDYKLNISNFSKTFFIEEGSVISWSGDPSDALVDINAIYPLRNIKLNNLFPEENEDIEKSKVNCTVDLSGSLLDPALKLGIVFPDNVNQKYINVVQSFNEKERNEQFLTLLLMKRFLVSSRANFADSKPVVGDLLTSQLSELLSKLSNDFNISLDYQPGQETVSDEYGVEVSGSKLDEKLIYKGGIGIGGKETGEDKNAFIFEGEIEYKLSKNIKLKAYNRANDMLENEGNYTQGVGIIWRKKFDSFLFWEKLENTKKQDSVN